MSGKAQSFKPSQTVQQGGSAGLTGDDLYKYKAQKYHTKCHQKLKEIMSGGAPCPRGYEKYLKPFQQ